MRAALHPPVIPDVGILALPYHQWGARWMTPHYVLTRLAHYFNVLWLEPAHHWRDIARPRPRHSFATAIPPGFATYMPEPWLPDFYRPKWFRHNLLRARVRRGWRRLEARGCSKRVLYLWQPSFEPALDAERYDVALYHIDDEYSFSPEAPPTSPEEIRVLTRVDAAFAVSPALMERKSGVNPYLHFVPEGVDFRLYSTPIAEPEDLAPIPHPRVGYTGALKRQLDWPLLRELARRNQHWSFVFVGPRVLSPRDESIVDEMARYGNVHFLGPKTVTELAAYPQHFDVCIMPYVVDGYTNNIYPLKLHEYLASGTAVVGSPIRTLEDYTHVLQLATSVEEWSTALRQAIESPEIRAASVARQSVAREHDWTELVHRIAVTICSSLGPEFSARLERIDVGVTPEASVRSRLEAP